MKKHLFSFGLLVLTLLATISLTACGSDDDGPSSTNVRASDLTAPWMLFELNNNVTDQAFWAFDGQHAASGTMIGETGEFRNITLYDSWRIDGGHLIVGGRDVGAISKERAEGIDLIIIGNQLFLQSNVKIDGRSLEDDLGEMGITRQLLWTLLQNAN